MNPDIVDNVRAAGVVGAGGAGFPTHVKLQFEAEQVLANGASCEPLLNSDPFLVEAFAEDVLNGLGTVMAVANAGLGKICIKSKHQRAVSAIEEKLASGGHGRIQLAELEDFYPAGDEFILVNEVLGKIVPEGGIPLNVLTVVCNVESLLNVSRAMKGKPVTDRYLTVCGEVATPMICRAPIGTPAEEIIQAAGGTTMGDTAVVMGGPMMGRVLGSSAEPVVKTTSGIIALPRHHNVVRDKQKDLERMRFVAKSACTQCSRCTELCPRNLIGHSLEPHKIMRHLAYTPGMTGDILEDALICSECGVCEKFACPMMLSPREINAAIKRKLMAEGVKREPKRETYRVSPFKDTRKVPISRLLERLDVKKYDTHPPFSDVSIRPDRVVIPLQQHIGKPCEPVVRVGGTVKRGDLVGEIPEGALGARVHASIDGRITSVDEGQIVIER
jgi:Na+-translocating ferredoxin:NAD+ oxidoreductase RnfC subunit